MILHSLSCLLNRLSTTAEKIISEDLPRVPIFYKHLHTKVGSENNSGSLWCNKCAFWPTYVRKKVAQGHIQYHPKQNAAKTLNLNIWLEIVPLYLVLLCLFYSWNHSVVPYCILLATNWPLCWNFYQIAVNVLSIWQSSIELADLSVRTNHLGAQTVPNLQKRSIVCPQSCS